MSRKWINFFTDAGIPASAAASYALIFSENRISDEMLLDLDREVLKEMGIQLMGDVISILKHARYVHEKTARETVLQSSDKEKVSQPAEKPVKKTVVSTVSVPENDPYFYSAPSQKKKAAEESKIAQKVGPVLPPSMKLPGTSSLPTQQVSSDSGSSEKTSPDLKSRKARRRKIKTSVQKGVIVKEEALMSESSSDSSSSSSLEYVKKKRKVMPEPKTSSQPVSKSFTTSGTKRTVSILDKEPQIIPKAGTTFTITMSQPSSQTTNTTKSVFSRLDSKLGLDTSDSANLSYEPITTEDCSDSSFFNDGIQPRVEFINDLCVRPPQFYARNDPKKFNEPIAKVKPFIQSEGILANSVPQLKVSPKERLGQSDVPVTSVDRRPNFLNSDYSLVDTVHRYQDNRLKIKEERDLDDNLTIYTNGKKAGKVFEKILEKKVSVPVMDYETMSKPSVKARINLNRSSIRKEGIVANKPNLSIRQRITMSPAATAAKKYNVNVSSVKDRISLKTPPARQKISFSSNTQTRENSKLGSVNKIGKVSQTSQVKDRLSLKTTSQNSVKSRLGKSFSSANQDQSKTIRNGSTTKQTKTGSGVFSRLG